jgi:hypothetical protein
MISKQIRELENLKGSGIAYPVGHPPVKVLYQVKVWREVTIRPALGESIETEGLQDAAGVLMVAEEGQHVPDITGLLTLKLDDGRSREFLAYKYNPITCTYQLKSMGDWLSS